MKVAVHILVILGIVASLGLGIKWVSDYEDLKGQLVEASDTATDLGIDVSEEMKQVENLRICAFVLIAGGIVSALALIFMGKLKKISAGLILLSAAVPAVIVPASLIFTFLLVIGGLLAFFVKPKAAVAA